MSFQDEGEKQIEAQLRVGHTTVDFKLTRKDLELPFSTFAQRYLEPAFTAIVRYKNG